MTSRSSDLHTVELTTAVIGPRSRGRDYSILRRAGPALSDDASAALADIAMVLTGWALTRARRPIAFMFPVTPQQDAFAVLRAAYQGEGALGPMAFANVVIAPAAVLAQIGWASHRLLKAIPSAGDDTFAQSAFSLDLDDLTMEPPAPTTPPDAAWKDQAIEADIAEPEEALGWVMDAIQPAEQRARISGWTTTANLMRVGRLDPAKAFRLVFHTADQSTAMFDATHQRVSLRDAVEPPAPPPLAWRVWSLLNRQASEVDGGSPLRKVEWLRQMIQGEPSAVAAQVVLLAGVGAKPSQQVQLLVAAAETADQAEAETADAVLKGVGEALSRLFDNVGGSKAGAYYVQGLLDALPATTLDRIDTVSALAAIPEVSEALGVSALNADNQVLIDHWAQAISGRPEDLLHLAPAVAARALASVVRPPDLDAASYALATRLCCALAWQTPDEPVLRTALDRLLKEAPSERDLDLAQPSFVDATADDDDLFCRLLNRTVNSKWATPADLRRDGDLCLRVVSMALRAREIGRLAA
ncbi:hypothetical protein [Brevundimonas sp.]|uniref:hypothetical protein n=1 Tax=Brevundimonas sp. TaxID=1871086 RepID=UPI003D143B98